MKLSEFKYYLPQELIALHPTEERDEARLMVLDRKTKTIEHKKFKDILDYFDEGDLFVMNNTRVFPALLYGEKEQTRAKNPCFPTTRIGRGKPSLGCFSRPGPQNPYRQQTLLLRRR